MPRYALLMEYDGSFFSGFQRQIHQISVQGFLEEKIGIFTKKSVTLHVSGRTDTGVHALGQVAHFDSDETLDPFKLKGCLNHFGRDKGVSILDIKEVSPDFHARFSSLERSYLYIILNRSSPSPLLKGRVAHVVSPLDIKKMQEAACKLLGHHNFESFRSAHCQAKNSFRTLNHCDVSSQRDLVIINVRSRSFLHNQVRILVGTLLHIGLLKKEPSWIDDLLQIPDRTKSGPTAPAEGLYFESVKYAQDIFKTTPLLPF